MSFETFGFYKRILPFYRAEPRTAVLTVSMLFVSVALLAVIPLLLRRATDAGLAGGIDVAALVISRDIFLLFLCTGAWAVVSSLFKYVQGNMNDRIATNLRGRLYRAWLARSSPQDDHQFGVIARLTGDIAAFHLGLELATSVLPAALIQCIVAIALMAYVSPTLFAVAFTAIVLVGATFPLAERRLLRLSSAAQEQYSRAISLAVEVLPEAHFVQRFGQQDQEVRRFEGEQLKLRMNLMRLRRLSLMVRAGMFGALALSSAVVIIIGVDQIHNGGLSPGTLVAFLGLGVVAAGSFALTVDAVGGIAKAASPLQRVTELEIAEMSSRPASVSATGRPRLSPNAPRIELHGVTFSYPADEGEALLFRLGPLDLSIDAGESVAFVGRSGSGKSTAARLVAGELVPAEGVVLIDGTEADGFADRVLQERVAYVAPHPTIFTRTLRENVAYGHPDATDSEVEEALKAAALADLLHSSLDGVGSVLWKRGEDLSTGQKQRIALARTLLLRPTIVILDEATSALDSQTEAEIVRYLRCEMTQSTKIIVSHRLSSVCRCDRIYHFQNGSVTEFGRHEELIASQGAYYQMFRDQIEAGLS